MASLSMARSVAMVFRIESFESMRSGSSSLFVRFIAGFLSIDTTQSLTCSRVRSRRNTSPRTGRTWRRKETSYREKVPAASEAFQSGDIVLSKNAARVGVGGFSFGSRSEEHTSELQS